MKSNDKQIGRFKRIGLILIWAASLVFAGQWGQSQTVSKSPATPAIITGNDFGFRVDERIGDVIAGTIVVRVDGEWLATGSSRTIRPSTTPGK